MSQLRAETVGKMTNCIKNHQLHHFMKYIPLCLNNIRSLLNQITSRDLNRIIKGQEAIIDNNDTHPIN